MKRAAVIVALILMVAFFVFRSHILAAFRPAPQTVTMAEAAQNIGRYVRIVARVSDVAATASGTVFLDFGGAYPDQSLTVLIPAEDARRFADPQSFRNRMVRVTGRLDRYRGKPEIVVRTPTQLVNLD